MAMQEVTPAQIQTAAAAGVELLNVEGLSVPLSIAKSGSLAILEGILRALSKGEVVLGTPQLESIDGGKKETG